MRASRILRRWSSAGAAAPRCVSSGSLKRAIWLRPSSLARYIAWSAATSTASAPAVVLAAEHRDPDADRRRRRPPESAGSALGDLGAQVLAELHRARRCRSAASAPRTRRRRGGRRCRWSADPFAQDRRRRWRIRLSPAWWPRRVVDRLEPVDSRQHAREAAVPDTPGPYSAEIDNFRFAPTSIDVGAGGELTWTNKQNVEHTVVSDDGKFGSGVLGVNDTFSTKFATPGTYPYHCSIHPFMKGTVVVK